MLGSRFVLGVVCAVCIAPSSLSAISSKESLRISATAAASEILVGEPLLLSVRFSGAARLYLGDLSRDNQHLRVLIDRGAGFLPYRPPTLFSPWREGGKTAIKEGGATIEFVLIFDERTKDWAFPTTGRSRLVVEYRDPELGEVRSNEVAVTTTRPPAREERVLREIRRIGPLLVSAPGPAPVHPALESLIQAYPSSRYLHRLRIDDLAVRLDLVTTRGPDARNGATRDAVQRELVALLGAARELADIDSQFTPDALLLLAELQGHCGDTEARTATLEGIVRDYPRRVAANIARDGLDGH